MRTLLAAAVFCLTGNLALAAPPDHGPGGPKGPPGPDWQEQGGAHGQGPGPKAHGQGRPGAGPAAGGPPDLGPARERIQALRGQIGRGGDLPPGLRLERGRPLPPGYGRPLPPGIARQLPDYPGYEWRRLGTDMVLVAVGTGLVYAILQGVLD